MLRCALAFGKRLNEIGKHTMDVNVVVVKCPECEKRFKPKGDVQGKKIRCPFCRAPSFVLAAKDGKPDKGKPDKAKAPKPQPKADEPIAMEPTEAETKAAAEAKVVADKAAADAEFDDKSAYDVKHVALVPRCPNCTAEMGPHDIICLECGYNTLTREWGKTQKTKAITFKQELKYLGPALGAAAFILFSVVGLLYYTIVSPYDVDKTIFEFTNTEAIRMWSTVIFLGWLFGAGTFCIKKFIEKPKPDEISTEE